MIYKMRIGNDQNLYLAYKTQYHLYIKGLSYPYQYIIDERVDLNLEKNGWYKNKQFLTDIFVE